MPNCDLCLDRGEIARMSPDGWDTERCPECNAPQWFVVKASRLFEHRSYSGPALKHTSFAGRKNTTFNSYDEAVKCARELCDVNPVGFVVYHDNGNHVWPVKFEEL